MLKELHFYLEESVCRNLHARCSGFIHRVLDTTNFDIQGTEEMQYCNHMLEQGTVLLCGTKGNGTV